MDELLNTIITGLPNLAVALYALRTADLRVDRMITLLERLLEQNRVLQDAQVLKDGAPKSPSN